MFGHLLAVVTVCDSTAASLSIIRGRKACTQSQRSLDSAAGHTGVCSSANAELVHSLGASRVIDYSREDFTRDGGTWDVIVDVAGTAPFSRVRKSLAEGGRLLVILGNLADTLRAPLVSMTGSRKIIAGPAPSSTMLRSSVPLQNSSRTIKAVRLALTRSG